MYHIMVPILLNIQLILQITENNINFTIAVAKILYNYVE